jgi:fucose permease
MTVFALLGATALWLLYAWLLSAIVASYLSGRKGYSEKAGLATGLLLHVLGVIIWLVWPARAESKWKTLGPFGRGRERQRARDADAASSPE